MHSRIISFRLSFGSSVKYQYLTGSSIYFIVYNQLVLIARAQTYFLCTNCYSIRIIFRHTTRTSLAYLVWPSVLCSCTSRYKAARKQVGYPQKKSMFCCYANELRLWYVYLKSELPYIIRLHILIYCRFIFMSLWIIRVNR